MASGKKTMLPLSSGNEGSTQPLKIAHLVAFDSPRQAFYTFWIEPYQKAFRVCKVSGAQGKVLHRQAWEFDSLDEAEAMFQKRLREKTNASRLSRRYRLSSLLPLLPGED